jgi:hypothetical protein
MVTRIAGRAMLVLVALLAGVQAAAAGTSTSFPNVVFSDGFESGTLGTWANLGIGSTTVVSAAAHAGSDGLRMTNASGQYGIVMQSLSSPVSDSSTSFYVRIGSNAGVQTVAQARDSGNGTQYWALLYDGGQHGFWFYPRIGSSATEIFTGQNSANAGAWIKVEVRYTATSTGGAQLLVNDQTQAGWGASGDLSSDGGYQRLQLWNDATNTTDFDDVVVATPPAALPGAPTGVAGTPGTGSVALTWNAGADGGSPITGYRITPSTGGTSLPSILTGSNATSYLVTGLTNGTPYTFTVAAINGTGTGPDSAASAPVTPAVRNAIQTENSLPGDPSWGDFAAPNDPTGISGYGSKISVNHGQSLDLYVTTTAANVTLDVYRLGWYNGVGARKMASLGTFPGVNQTQATPNPTTGIVEEHWSKTTTLNVPTSWTTGLYLVRLLASNGFGGFIMFVVRDDGGHEPILMQASVTTYQAYNPYGGTSLYNNNTNHSIFTGPHATKVSFDRPFQTGNGAGQVLWYEYPMLRWLEKNGDDVAYTSDMDTHEGTSTLTDHKTLFSVGHDEYWSKAMRDNVEGAIAAGVNVAFFGANDSYWQIRMEPSSTGVPDRVEVGYKDFADCACAPGPDPQWNVNNSILTGLFRNPLTNRPEERMLGNMFGGETFNSDYIVQNASHWIYAGTGWTNGTHVPGLVGYEYNHYFGDSNTPPGTVVLSNTPLVNTENNQADTANAVFYTAPSGARVFQAATIQWSWGLDNYGGTSMVNAGVQRVTQNIIDNFTAGAPPPPPTPPGAPTGVSGTAQNAAVALTWSAPASNGGAPITGYRVTPYIGATAQPAVLTGSSATSYTVTGLTNGTAYTFKVAAINSAGTGSDSTASAAVTPLALPGAPTAVVGTAGNGQVALSWTAPSSNGGSPITGYRVTPSIGGSTQTPILTGSTATTFTVTGLTNGTAYTFTVAAINASGTGPESAASAAVTPITVPSAPSAVGGTPADASVALTWTAPSSNGGSAILRYTITPSIGGVAQTPVQTASAGTSFTVTGLTNGTAYTFTVAAVNAAGTGPASAASAPVTPAAGSGSGGTAVFSDDFESGSASNWTSTGIGTVAVSAAAAHAGSDGLRLTNAASQYDVLSKTLASALPDSITSFWLRVGSAGGWQTIAQARDSTSSSVVWALLYDSAGQQFWFYPFNGGSATEIPTGANSAPIGSWIKVDIRYTVAASGGAQISLNGQTQTAWGVSGNFAAAKTLEKLQLWNDAVNSTDFDDVSISTPGTTATAPGAPTGVSGTAGNTSVALSWTAPASDGGSAITGYRITPFIGATAQTAIVTGSAATSATVTGLTNGTAYTFTVAAINGVGTGSASAASAAVTPSALPGAPTAVAGTAGNGQVALTWTAPASNGGSALTSYLVTEYIGGVAQPVLMNTGSTATSYTVTGLTNGTAYTFTVSAINGNGTGPESAQSAAITPGAVPGAPTAVTGTAGNAQVALSWTAPSSDGGSAITGYRVTPYIGATAQTAKLTGSTATSYTVTGLTNGTAYTFKVAAINVSGTGADSTASAALTPVTVPGAPTAVVGTAGNAQVALSWTAPASNGGSAITGYRVTPFIGATAQTAKLTGSTATTYTVTGLTNGTAYTFTVAAITAVGTGADSAASAAVTPSATTVAFSDGFESGSTSNWTNTGVGTVAVNAAGAHAGSFGLRFTNTAGQYDVLVNTLPSALSASTTSFWVRIGSAGGWQTIAQARNSTSSAVVWALLYDSASQQFYFYPFNGSSATEIGTGAGSAPVGSWIKVDIRYTATATGGAQISLNGQTQAAWSVSGNYAAANTLQRLQLWNDVVNTTDFDDVSVTTP